jgi:UDP-N-acetylglucosamine 2-epimerase (non-hydrolysing)
VVAHVEAGLRSFDDDMPEEVNRRLTDSISDLLFVSEPSGAANLRREGVPGDRIYFVGNVMIDSLLAARARSGSSTIRTRLGVRQRSYAVLTLHRPSNVDDPARLRRILLDLQSRLSGLSVVCPVHPRTRGRLDETGLALEPPAFTLTEPLGYLDFVHLLSEATVVLTDSGGVQEETTVLGVPCVTLRENTERPITVEQGTNVLAGTTPDGLARALEAALEAPRRSARPDLWDGEAASRIARVLVDTFEKA